ncbi:REP-associated tyrosine transposase [Candidatus Thiosymbion oneisti]|uniref:REP-associated tyrosine transposase n=1 Tax=Candidatus Thiosymbion oneisti TaxID=589554 RepID=UPI000ABB9EAA|nr:transposase [Candidatus Thiosymbion oneisti]
MTSWRRVYQPGGTVFFTLVTEGRAPILTTSDGRRILRSVMSACRERWPFKIPATVLLPDHLHTIWTLPDGDSDYSTRWAWLKKEFTKAWLESGGTEQVISLSRRSNRRRGVLQRRFWEHTIRDERDFQRHLNYIHYNPVRHGYADCAVKWPWSSFHRYLRNGMYTAEWGCTELCFTDIEHTVGE